jgi:DNA-binding LacI/PurR family transcriptional regulator
MTAGRFDREWRANVGIKELADYLNVSIGTVSRALNNHPLVNADTRRRVMEAAEEMGYAPDQSGRALRKGTVNSIALVLSTDRTSSQEALIFMEISRGMQSVLRRHELDLMIHLNEPGQELVDRVRRVVERRQADAIVLAETRQDDPRLDYLTKRKVPFATWGRSLSGGPHPWLDFDFDLTMVETIDRLTAFGHRRIALVSSKPALMLDQFLKAAYERELAARGLPFRLELDAATDERGGYQVVERALASPDRPTAIIFSHYRPAAGAYLAFNEAGIVPGRDIAITSCSVDTPMAGYLSPGLTCFGVDVKRLGERLAEAVLSGMPRFAAEFGDAPIQEMVPLQLISRGSDTFTFSGR